MADLIKIRTSSKAQITRIANWYAKNKDKIVDKTQLEFKRESLNNHFKKYSEAQDELDTLTLNPPDEEDRDLIEDNYVAVLSQFQNHLEILNKPLHLNTQSVVHSNIKLPSINIKIFTGVSTEYQSFIDLFTALIINNASLHSNTEKFFYLKAHLRGEPLLLIDNIAVTEQNFSIALGLLHKRYSNHKQLVNSYFKQILDVPSIQKCNANMLRQFSSNSKAALDALLTLNFSKEKLFDHLITYLLESKLDYATRRAFEEHIDSNDLTDSKTFFDFLNNRCSILENLSSAESLMDKKPHFKNNFNSDKSKITLFSNSNPPAQEIYKNSDYRTQSNANQSSSSVSMQCVFCNDTTHRIYSCQKFVQMSVSDRLNFVKVTKLCFNCLGTRHTLGECGSSRVCDICRKKHHSLLHLSPPHHQKNVALNSFSSPNHLASSTPSQSKPSDSLRSHSQSNYSTPLSSREGGSLRSQPPNRFSSSSSRTHSSMVNTTTLSATKLCASQVLLATAKMLVFPSQGPPIVVKGLLDNGSQCSFITCKTAEMLQCKFVSHSLQISGIFNGKTALNKMTDIEIHSRHDPATKFKISCAVVDRITQNLPQLPIHKNLLQIPYHISQELADDTFDTPSEIGLLLGADIYYNLLKPGMEPLGTGLPTLISTHLGWVISGTLPSQYISPMVSVNVASHSFHVSVNPDVVDDKLDVILQTFFDQEEVSSPPLAIEEDARVEQIFVSSTEILPDGRFQVHLPLIYPQAHCQLGDSFISARNRFSSLERKFNKNPSLKSEYKQILEDYITLGHAKIVPLSLLSPVSSHKYFVPHLCVVRNQSSSTKLRIVFDFSSKTSNSLSLNDITLTGPRVQPELFDTLIRFRSFIYALTADIEKMYRQVYMHPSFHCLQNVLWRDSPQDPFTCLELTTVSFGQRSAPYLACRVLKEIALQNPQLPHVQEALLYQTYVDDILTGANSILELEQLYFDLKQTLASSGFNLHKFCSNSNSTSRKLFSDISLNKELFSKENPCTVLGITWNPAPDILKIHTPSSLDKSVLTKRVILSIIAQCYDPLGLVNPVIVQGKLLMQHLWHLRLQWDTPINDPHIQSTWTKFLTTLILLKDISIPRCLRAHNEVLSFELHGFCDASGKAYGGCVYLRTIYVDQSATSHLVAAKSKVSPLSKPLTIPKLELNGMVLLAKLFSRISLTFKNTIPISRHILWSDSQVALSWIKSPPGRWTAFVSNRVTQIQNLTSDASWRHIRSHLNPADLLSRGTSLTTHSSLWFSGPDFLHKSSSDTVMYDSFSQLSQLPEERRTVLLSVHPAPNYWIEFISKFSSFTKLLRSMAYVLRFAHNLRNPDKYTGPLSSSELHESRRMLIIQVQGSAFSHVRRLLKNNKAPQDKHLMSLNVFLDQDSIIRVGGRLTHADIPLDQQHPILLPSKSQFVTLLLKHEHVRLGHSGSQNVLNNVRTRFWPLNGLREVKRIIHNCILCRRLAAVTAQQIMADLPKERVTPSRPFVHVGVDFGGPFLIKSSTLKKAPIIKCYMALFICLGTKAVHLELVSDLSADAFLACLKRFVSRRGVPTTIFSDNATNFVGAHNQLKEIYDLFNSPNSAIFDHVASLSITWKYIPPRSPHWGGLWEAAIKSAKYHIIRMLGDSHYVFEQFATILAQIEAIMNSRPLFPLSSDPHDLQPLTPGHFLIGAPLVTLPDRDCADVPANRLKFWQHCTKIHQCFWKRWSKDYLNRLQNRPKWLTPHPNLKVGDMVLVKDEETPPLKWPLARIVNILTGPDEKVRAVQVKTPSGTYSRSIVKIVPLPVTDDNIYPF